MRYLLAGAALLVLAACEDPGGASVPSGPAIEITEAVRLFDRVRVVMRYRNGDAIAVDDEMRAVQKGASIACNEGEETIADTRERDGGLLTVHYFCVATPTSSDEVIDGTGLKV
jgi:hypothetical protein